MSLQDGVQVASSAFFLRTYFVVYPDIHTYARSLVLNARFEEFNAKNGFLLYSQGFRNIQSISIIVHVLLLTSTAAIPLALCLGSCVCTCSCVLCTAEARRHLFTDRSDRTSGSWFCHPSHNGKTILSQSGKSEGNWPRQKETVLEQFRFYYWKIYLYD